MEESLRDEQIDAGGPNPAAGKLVELPAYEPDQEAYKVDEANDPYRRFTESIMAGATIRLSLGCQDGRRELIELDNTESQAWIRDSLEDRITFANAKICERRARVAIATAARLQGRAIVEHRDLKPDQEACLREFELLEDVLVPLEEGGYAKRMRTIRCNAPPAARCI